MKTANHKLIGASGAASARLSCASCITLKLIHFRLWLLLALATAGFTSGLRGQVTALDAIVFNGARTVNTTWLGNAGGSGTYTFVYQASGSNSWAIASQSGSLPVGFVSPPPSGTFVTADVLVTANDRYYIRRTRVWGSCAGWGWTDGIYTGPLTNQIPIVSLFTIAPASVPRGALTTLTSNVIDADANLTSVRIDHLPPGAGSWTLGTAAAGTAWTGTATGARSLTQTFLLPTAGPWSFRVSGTDSLSATSSFTSGTVTVADTPYYDPANFHNGVLPTLVVTQGNGLFGVAGQFNSAATVVRVQTQAGLPLAGAPVLVTVMSGGGGLASTASGAGTATLVLTTNASGVAQFFYRQPTIPYAVSALQVVSGMGTASISSFAYTAADAAADADGDGLSAATETALGTPANIANALESVPSILSVIIHAPQR
ncbi:MAG: hypothetical protein EAZ36_03355 [Verrucomicrobia bacterium]|nr:MAG: hypothetical protein EAZ36_03355 [Verrucomicrobiota bacterium]